MKNKLIIFAKEPKAGEVKTRLGKSIGMQEACDIYEALLCELMQLCLEQKSFETLIYSANGLEYFQQKWPSISTKQQLGPNLGERLKNALVAEFAEPANIVLIGSDCPKLSIDTIQQAFAELQNNDLAIGPAEDGGYYLIAMSKYLNVFEDIQWSTANVLKQTLAHATAQKLKSQLLPPLSDLDNIEDLLKHKNLFLESEQLKELWPLHALK